MAIKNWEPECCDPTFVPFLKKYKLPEEKALGIVGKLHQFFLDYVKDVPDNILTYGDLHEHLETLPESDRTNNLFYELGWFSNEHQKWKEGNL